MTFTRKILVGLGAGIAVGLFFGESACGPEIGRRRLRQAAADDGAALRHGLDRDEPGIAQLRAGAHPGAPRRRGAWRALGGRVALRVPDSAGVSRRRQRHVLQLGAARAPSGLQLRRSLHPVEPVQLARQQHRSRRRAVLGHRRRGADRRRAQAEAARRAGDGQRGVEAGHPLHRAAHAVWPVRHRGHGRRHAEHRAVGAAAGVPPHLRGSGPAAEPLGPARSGGDADAHPGAGDVQPDARRVDHRVCRRGPVHRAAGAGRGQPDVDRAARAAIAGRGRPARRAGARLVQLSAHRQAVVDQLHALRAGSRMRPCRSATTRNWP